MSAKTLKHIRWALSALSGAVVAAAIHFFGWWVILPMAAYLLLYAIRDEVIQAQKDAEQREKFRAYKRRLVSRPGRAEP